ncbi:MAG: ComEC/Rec2 family competence protein [Candidatus Brocadiia bacterium]
MSEGDASPKEASPAAPPRLPAVGILVFAAVGLVIGQLFTPAASNPFFLAALLAASFAAVVGLKGALGHPSSRATALVWLAVSLLIAGLAARSNVSPASPPSQTCTVSGDIESLFQSERGSYCSLVNVKFGGIPADSPMRVAFDVAEGDLAVGCRVEFVADVDADNRGYFAERVLFIKSVEAAPWGIGLALAAVRERMGLMIRSNLDAQSGGLVEACTFGTRGNLDAEWRTAFLYSGNGHLLAVSGLNAAVVAAVALWITALLRLSLSIRWLAAMPFIFAYLLLVGFNAPAVRATLGVVAVAAAVWSGRRGSTINALAAVAVAMMAFWPQDAVQAPFLLSFLAVAGILILGAPLAKAVVGDVGKRPVAAAINWLSQGALYSLSAWAFTVPLLAYFFGNVTPLSFLAAIPTVPLSAALVPAGLILVVSHTVTGGAFVISAPSAWLAHAIAALNKGFAAIPGGFEVCTRPPVLATCLWILLLLIGAMLLYFGRKRLAAAAFAAIIVIAVFEYPHPNGVFEIGGKGRARLVAVVSGGKAVAFDFGAREEWIVRRLCHMSYIPPPAAIVRMGRSEKEARASDGLCPVYEPYPSMHPGTVDYSSGKELMWGSVVAHAGAPQRLPSVLMRLAPSAFAPMWEVRGTPNGTMVLTEDRSD